RQDNVRTGHGPGRWLVSGPAGILRRSGRVWRPGQAGRRRRCSAGTPGWDGTRRSRRRARRRGGSASARRSGPAGLVTGWGPRPSLLSLPQPALPFYALPRLTWPSLITARLATVTG